MNPVAKLAIAGINMGAAALVGKGLGAAWTKATGNQPPAISHASGHPLDRSDLRRGCCGELRYCSPAASFLQLRLCAFRAKVHELGGTYLHSVRTAWCSFFSTPAPLQPVSCRRYAEAPPRHPKAQL